MRYHVTCTCHLNETRQDLVWCKKLKLAQARENKTKKNDEKDRRAAQTKKKKEKKEKMKAGLGPALQVGPLPIQVCSKEKESKQSKRGERTRPASKREKANQR